MTRRNAVNIKPQADTQHGPGGAETATDTGVSVQVQGTSGEANRTGTGHQNLQGVTALGSGTIAPVEQIRVEYVPPMPTLSPIPIPDNVSALNQRGDQGQNGGETKAESDAAGESAVGASGAEAAAGQFSKVRFAGMLAAVVAMCALDKIATSDSMAAHKKSRNSLADGTSANTQAAAAVLEIVQYLKTQPPEIIKKTVESLTVVKKDKQVKQKYGACLSG